MDRALVSGTRCGGSIPLGGKKRSLCNRTYALSFPIQSSYPMTIDTTQQKIKALTCRWLYCDGASRGNPGEAAVGAVLLEKETNEILFKVSKCIGLATNNVAEYTALIVGLEKTLELGIKHLEIFLDSELVVRQLSGRYGVKNAKMRQLFKKVQELLRQLEDYKVHHIPRERNWQADSLANQALDTKK